MLTSEALVATDRPSRYLAQLCRHVQHLHRLRLHRIRYRAGDTRQPPAVVRVEWSRARGVISFSWGLCTMEAGPGTLILGAEAADEQHLQRLEEMLTANIERFGRREHLKVEWQRPGAAA